MRQGTAARLRRWHQRFEDRPLGVGQIGRVGAVGHHPTSKKPLYCEYPESIPPSQTPSYLNEDADAEETARAVREAGQRGITACAKGENRLA
jgi:hypothetical protein